MAIRQKELLPPVEEVVTEGLTGTPKYLPSWLFYDDAGSMLFREIMTLPEYYLTSCEQQILERFSDAIAYNFRALSRRWDVVELGAGDGSKTGILLNAFLQNGIQTAYFAIDISEKALTDLSDSFRQHLPGLAVLPVQADFIGGLNALPESGNPRLILFLGANIGNFETDDASVFLRSISARLSPRDRLIIGFDLMKSPSVIEKAYNDYRGITTLFNKNVLVRLNRELQANFDTRNFEHWPIYDVVTGACQSYLVSLKPHTVTLRKINLTVSFHEWEAIHMEVSQKYSETMIVDLASAAKLSVERMIYDDRRYFALAFFVNTANS